MTWRSIVKCISDIADGRDNLDGFPRSRDEKQRRLTEIKVLCLDALKAAPTTSPEPDAVKHRAHMREIIDANCYVAATGDGYYVSGIEQAVEQILASLSAPVAGTWPKPIAEAPREADEILLVSFQEQGPNGLVYVSLNNGCWDEAQQCFVLGPRGCSTNAVGDGHSTHWLPRSWLPDVAATCKERGTHAL